MITVNSISGGQTSSFVAAHYPADHDLFALVRTEDNNCIYPDKKIRQMVEDRIQKPFIGTLEDDLIIQTIFDLEQFLGRRITWVSGITYDEVVEKKGGWLPNKLHRYCTTWLKITPMAHWWAENIGEPVEMRLGYRANEQNRKKTMIEKLNDDGLLVMKMTFEKNSRGQNKWEDVAWQKPVFPLIDDKPTLKPEISEFWKDKPVAFAQLNNCVGCFHRNPLLLRKMFDKHPNKMEWFAKQERREKKGQWRTDVSYDKIKNHKVQIEIDFNDFGECDSGFCTN